MQNNNIKDKYNDYLNYSKSYKSGGIMTTYNTGGSHSENPHGGIPIGNNALVEQRETSVNLDDNGVPTQQPTGSKYIFSDRQIWTPEDLKSAGLPTSRKAVTAAEYMAKLNGKFSDRSGNHADKETLNTFTKRATELAENKRLKEQALNEAIKANSQQNQIAPENTDIPEGMEEFAYGGLQADMPVADAELANTGATSGALSGTGAYIQAAGTAFDLYNTAKTGNTSVHKDKAIGSLALKGAAAGASIGSVVPGLGTVAGGLIGGVVGGVSGYLGSNKARKNESNDQIQATYQVNAGMPNAAAWTGIGGPAQQGIVSAMGGYITSKPAKYANGGLIDPNANPVNPIELRSEDKERSMERYKLLRALAVRGSGIKSDYKPDLRTSEQKQMDYQYLRDSAKPGFKVDTGYRPDLRSPESAMLDYKKARNNNVAEFADGGFKPDWMNDPYLQPNTNPIYGGAGTLLDNDLTASLASQYKTTNQSITPASFNINKYLNTAKQYAGKAGDWLSENKNDIARAYPIISNFIERDKIRKPVGTYSARLSDAYDVPQIDEANAMRDINTVYNNRYRALGQMGGSQAQQRANMLGIGAQQNQVISQTQANLEALRNNRAMQEQQFKSQIAQYNAGKSDYDREIYDKDIANYETQRSKFTSQIGNDIGAIGLEQDRMDQVANMYGYDRKGKYLINRETGRPATPEETSKLLEAAKKLPLRTSEVTTNRYGGFINRKPSKY